VRRATQQGGDLGAQLSKQVAFGADAGIRDVAQGMGGLIHPGILDMASS
jgi:hypothetical protein